jgi:hypothetical protein
MCMFASVLELPLRQSDPLVFTSAGLPFDRRVQQVKGVKWSVDPSMWVGKRSGSSQQ